MNYNAKKLRFISNNSISSVVCFLTAFLLCSSAVAEEADLTPRAHAGSFSRVKTVVELAGSLNVHKLNKTDGDKDAQIKLPLKVDAELFFDEKGLAGEQAPSLRHYWVAKADLQVNKAKDHRELRDERNLVLLSQGVTANERYTSPYGSLSREELELIDIASNGFPPEQLLPSKTVELEEAWSHDEAVIAALLRVETITDGTLKSEVSKITADTVTIDIAGEVTGKVDGVKTVIEVKGNYLFDREAKLVTWIALAVRENRDISFAAPGFEVVSRIRTVREGVLKSDALPAKIADRVSKNPGDGDKLLDFVSEDDTFQMALDRRWYLLSYNKLSAKLRMVDDGDLLATCKIDQLTRTVPGKQVTLDGFRGDVRTALDKNCKEIVSASQSVSPQGVRILRVVAAGEVAETPIQWIYYHLSNDNGERLSYIFTLEASLESRFAGVDEAMTSSVRFLLQEEKAAEKQASLELESARK